MGVYHLTDPWGDVQDAAATFQFRCSLNVAQFRIRANAFAPTGSDNSFFLEVDTAGSVAWHLPKYARGAAESTSPSLGSVAAGTHTLAVRVREDGTWFASLTMDNDGCEFVVDNSQPGDREEFALVADTSCGGTSLDLTGGHQWYANSCAEVCAAEECAGYEKTKDEPCRFFGGSLCAAVVVSLAASWAVSEAMGLDEALSLDVTPKQAPVFYGCFLMVISVGVLVLMTGVSTVQLSAVVELINGLLLPFAIGFLFLLATGEALPPEVRVDGLHKAVLFVVFSVCVVISTASALYGLLGENAAKGGFPTTFGFP